MKMRWTPALIALAFAACNDADPVGPDPLTDPAFARTASYGGVYTATNQAGGNEILQFRRDDGGSLVLVNSFPTGGLGTGGGLGNQGAVTLSDNGRFLFAVNAGSNEVVVFRRGPDGSLSLADRASSGGEQPISVTQHGRTVYVLNEGGNGNIAGFALDNGGSLSPLGTQPLSQAGGVDPAQIQFSPNGRSLIVTEKNTNRIVTYPVHAGVAGAPRVQDSDGPTPFGFDFTNNGTLVVSNAAGGAAGAGSATSYRLGHDGGIDAVSAQVANGQAAPCWVVVTRNGKLAFVTNTASNTTSAFAIGPHGTLTLVGDGIAADNSGTPIDAAINRSGHEFLHVLNAGTGTIEVFAIERDGGLTFAGDASGLPAGTNGLAAY